MAVTKLEPGEARAPGPSYQEAILRDASQPPAAFLEYSYEFMGDENIPYSNYTSRDYAAREFEKLWPRGVADGLPGRAHSRAR